MVTLVCYGPNNLQNDKWSASYHEGFNMASNDVSRSPLARGYGSIPVNSRITEKSFTVRGQINSKGTTDLQNQIANFASMLSINDQYLRLVHDYTILNDTSSTTGFTAGGAFGTLTADSSAYQIKSRLLFNYTAPGGTGTGTITSTTLSATLPTLSGLDNLEFWLFIPDTTYLTNISLRLGNDNANYYSDITTLVDYQNKPLQNGWNLMSYSIQNLIAGTSTGSPNIATTLNYFYLSLSFSSSQVSMSGIGIESLMYVNDLRVRNYPCYRSGEVKIPISSSNITQAEYEVNFLNYTGYAIATNYEYLVNRTFTPTQTNNENYVDYVPPYALPPYSIGTLAPQTDSLTFLGSLPPKPEFMITGNDLYDANLGAILVKNVTTSQKIIAKSHFSSAGSNISIGGPNIAPYYISANNSASPYNTGYKDFTGSMPGFNLGLNRVEMYPALSGSTDSALYWETLSAELDVLAGTSDKYYIRFKAPTSGTLESVALYIRSTGAATYTINTVNDSSGAPGTQIGSSVTSAIGPTAQWTFIYLNSAITVVSGTWYGILLSGYASSTDRLAISYDNNIYTTNPTEANFLSMSKIISSVQTAITGIPMARIQIKSSGTYPALKYQVRYKRFYL